MKVVYLHINDLEPNETNPFPKIDPKYFKKLCDSIRSNGLLHPLSVVKNDESGKYKILDGNHRFEAIQVIGNFQEVPCIIVDEENFIEYIFDPNIYRRHLPLNVIDAYEHEKTNAENDLLVKNLPSEILFLLENRKITKKEALRLAKLPWKTLKDFVSSKLSFRSEDTEEKKRQTELEKIIEEKERKIKEYEEKIRLLNEEIENTVYEEAKNSAKEEIENEYRDKIETLKKSKKEAENKLVEVETEKKEIKEQIKILQNILNSKDAIIQTLSEQLDSKESGKDTATPTSSSPPPDVDMLIIDKIIGSFFSSFDTLFSLVSNNLNSKNVKNAISKNLPKLKQISQKIHEITELG